MRSDMYIVLADAIVGCGTDYHQGQVIDQRELWGYEDFFVEHRAVQRVDTVSELARERFLQGHSASVW